MFLSYYGLREQPFGVTPDPRFLYFSAAHCEALASLSYGIESGCGFLALVALPGMGKTTLLFHLLEKLRSSAQTVFLFQTQCGSREFFRYLLTDLGADATDQNLARMHESLNAVLLRNARVGRRVILVIDEAQNLDDSVLETVRLLSDFETPQAKLLQIVLSGQPQLADKLSHPALTQLRQRISIVSRLHPFTRVETMVQIEYRLSRAGYSGPPLFEYDAAEMIAAYSGGIPRNINNICFNALTLGFAKRRKQIDASIVNEVLADLAMDGLGTRILSPKLTDHDSSSTFDKLSPTNEETYLDFLSAVRAAWAGNNGAKPLAEPAGSDLAINKTDKGRRSLLSISQNPAGSQSLSGTPVALNVEPAENGIEGTPAGAFQILPGIETQTGVPQTLEIGDRSDSLKLAHSDEAHCPPNASRLEMRTPHSENWEAVGAISPTGQGLPPGVSTPPQVRRYLTETSPQDVNSPSTVEGTAPSNFGAWSSAISQLLPHTHKAPAGAKKGHASVVRRTLTIGAIATVVGGSLTLGWAHESARLRAEKANSPAAGRVHLLNHLRTGEPAIPPEKPSVESSDIFNGAPSDKSSVITLESGQTLSEVSLRYLGRFNDQLTLQIQKLNPEIKNPDFIIVGTKIRLPMPSGVVDRNVSSSKPVLGIGEESR
jgi:general secretion pathway protein A